MRDDPLVIEPDVSAVTEELSREFHPPLPHDEVRQAVERSFESFAGSKIKAFVPVLARRQAKQELRDRIRLI